MALALLGGAAATWTSCNRCPSSLTVPNLDIEFEETAVISGTVSVKNLPPSVQISSITRDKAIWGRQTLWVSVEISDPNTIYDLQSIEIMVDEVGSLQILEILLSRGEATLGKRVGNIIITDLEIPDISYVLLRVGFDCSSKESCSIFVCARDEAASVYSSTLFCP